VSTPAPIPVPPPLPAREPPVWPVVIAVYSMVAAGYAALELVGRIVFNFSMLYRVASQGLSGGLPAGYNLYLLADLGRLLLAPLCLAAGRALYKRHVLGPTLHVIWGVLAALLGVAAFVGGMVISTNSLRITQLRTMLGSIAPLSCGLVANAAYPAFVVVWFSRRPVRRQMAGWRATAPAYSRPVWPAVIAAISLIKVGMDVVRSAAGTSMLLSRLVFPHDYRFGRLGAWTIASWVLAILGSLSALLLVPAGIALWRRRRWGATIHLVWVGAASAALVASVLTGAMEGGPWVWSFSRPYYATIRMIYPVFVLIWFTRPRVRRQVAAWGGPERDAALAVPQE
jgi:hypothetical protein